MLDVNPKELRAVADGKAPLDCIEPALNEPLARVMAHGAGKYGYRNYTASPIKLRTYIGAIRRHTDALALGEDIDPDSGQPHWAHIAACCAVLAGADAAGTLVDDRTALAEELAHGAHEVAASGRPAPELRCCIDSMAGAPRNHREAISDYCYTQCHYGGPKPARPDYARDFMLDN